MDSNVLGVLTLLFIGGASSCANLFTCQYVDGADEPLGMHAFRSQMPMLLCQDSSWQAFWADDRLGRRDEEQQCSALPNHLRDVAGEQ
eukprot:Skav212540  [mRNA]  locus=scaffold1851:411806:419276:+ [translate_table: standard]